MGVSISLHVSKISYNFQLTESGYNIIMPRKEITMRIDNKRKCEHPDGCSNLARIDHVINNVVKRGKFCEVHHRNRFPRTPRSWQWKGHYKKCLICSWEGPCDTHRLEEQGSYSVKNTISICPNCHRLHHFGIKIIDKNDYK